VSKIVSPTADDFSFRGLFGTRLNIRLIWACSAPLAPSFSLQPFHTDPYFQNPLSLLACLAPPVTSIPTVWCLSPLPLPPKDGVHWKGVVKVFLAPLTPVPRVRLQEEWCLRPQLMSNPNVNYWSTSFQTVYRAWFGPILCSPMWTKSRCYPIVHRVSVS